MLGRLAGVAVVVLVLTSQSFAFEVGALNRKIDTEKRLAVVFANGRERTVKIAADVKVRDEKGNFLLRLKASPRGPVERVK